VVLALGRLHTEHELGRRLREMRARGGLHQGGRPSKTGDVTSSVSQTLADIGFDYPNGKHDSADFQRRDG
jgi:hypothetical protein